MLHWSRSNEDWNGLGRAGYASKRRWRVSIALISIILRFVEVHPVMHKLAHSQLIVQLPGRVAVLRRPLHAGATLLRSLFRNRLNDLAPIAFPS